MSYRAGLACPCWHKFSPLMRVPCVIRHLPGQLSPSPPLRPCHDCVALRCVALFVGLCLTAQTTALGQYPGPCPSFWAINVQHIGGGGAGSGIMDFQVNWTAAASGGGVSASVFEWQGQYWQQVTQWTRTAIACGNGSYTLSWRGTSGKGYTVTAAVSTPGGSAGFYGTPAVIAP